MSSLDRRLIKLEDARRRRRPSPEPATAFDPRRLTAAERADLDELEGMVRRRPSGRCDFEALDDAALDRLTVLVYRGHGLDWTEDVGAPSGP